MKKVLFTLLITIITATTVFAAGIKVTTLGEADIMHGDTASARVQAVARAKWAALEQAAGIKVKSQAIMQNAALVDEAVKSETEGVVKSFKVTGEEEDGDIYRVQIEAVIEPEGAKEAVSTFSKNTAVAVMLPVVFPDKHVEEQNALSERVINDLTLNEMEVIDLASSSDGATVNMLEKALKTNNFMSVKNIAFKYMANTILIGKVETTATAKEGTDIGYGASLPFNVVNGRLTYRLIAEKNGRPVILASGYLNGRGMGATLEDATNKLMENLSESVATRLVSIVLEKFKGANNKFINVRIAGDTNVNKLVTLKQMLSYTSWVMSVQEQGVDTLVVQYPEKALYLATSINSKPGFSVKKLNDFEIVVNAQ